MKKPVLQITKLIIAAGFLVACSKNSFAPVAQGLDSNLQSVTQSESFDQNKLGDEVDILFIDDNSNSMATEQSKLGARFASFVGSLKGVNYHIGIVTTDTVNIADGARGQLAALKGGTGNFITPSTPNAAAVFEATIQRTEHGSSDETPMVAAIMAMNQKDTVNAGFFRDGADLAIVVLSDEDENSDGFSAIAVPPVSVVANFKSIWGDTKTLHAYGIVVQPGDAVCLQAQKDQGITFQQVSYYGTFATELARLTGGITGSVCDDDYSGTLQSIGENVTGLSKAFELRKIPKAGSIHVTLSTGQQIAFHMEGSRLVFDVPPPRGAKIQITYDPAE